MCADFCSILINIFASFVLAIIFSLLFYFGFINNIVMLLWIVLGSGILNFLTVLVKFVFLKDLDECDCKHGITMIISSIITTILSIMLLGTTITVTSIIDIISIAVLSFFTFFMIINFIIYLVCKIVNYCNCGCR